MFTGQPPVMHGAQLDDFAMDPATPLLTEVLSEAGWFSIGYWTGWYVAGDFGFSRGFALYENAMTGGRQLEEEYRLALEQGDFDAARAIMAGRAIQGHQDVTSGTVVERATVGMDVAPDGDNLFLFTHLFDPHYDYLPPAPFDTRFDPGYTGPFDGSNWYFDPRVWDPAKQPQRQISQRDLQHVYALYRGELAWVDDNLGRLMDALEREGRLENTLFIVTSDHGEEFFEHGSRGHRNTLYEEQLRVPMLIVPPVGTYPDAPRTSDLQVTLSDVLPTALDFADLDVPASAVGRSLLPVLEGVQLGPLPAVSSLVSFNQLPDGGFEFWFKETWRTPTEKLIRTSTMGLGGKRKLAQVEYFDLVANPKELLRPIIDPSDPHVVRTWSALEAELARLRALQAELPSTNLKGRSTDITQIFADELSKLGYASGDDKAASPGEQLPWGAGVLPAFALPSSQDQ